MLNISDKYFVYAIFSVFACLSRWKFVIFINVQVNWQSGKGWDAPTISPLHNLSLHPGSKVECNILRIIFLLLSNFACICTKFFSFRCSIMQLNYLKDWRHIRVLMEKFGYLDQIWTCSACDEQLKEHPYQFVLNFFLCTLRFIFLLDFYYTNYFYFLWKVA